MSDGPSLWERLRWAARWVLRRPAGVWDRTSVILMDETCGNDESADHLRETIRLDLENPGWDLKGRIAAAGLLLSKGVSRELVRSVYGDEVVSMVESDRE